MSGNEYPAIVTLNDGKKRLSSVPQRNRASALQHTALSMRNTLFIETEPLYSRKDAPAQGKEETAWLS